VTYWVATVLSCAAVLTKKQSKSGLVGCISHGFIISPVGCGLAYLKVFPLYTYVEQRYVSVLKSSTHTTWQDATLTF